MLLQLDWGTFFNLNLWLGLFNDNFEFFLLTVKILTLLISSFVLEMGNKKKNPKWVFTLLKHVNTYGAQVVIFWSIVFYNLVLWIWRLEEQGIKLYSKAIQEKFLNNLNWMYTNTCINREKLFGVKLAFRKGQVTGLVVLVSEKKKNNLLNIWIR